MKEKGIDSYYVGGCVRDKLMGIPIDDVDICLVNVTNAGVVTEILEKFCDKIVSDAGSRFPVWIGIIGNYKIDYALARRENLVGSSRKDFEIEIENVSIEDDLRRRDLTVNAIAINVLSNDYIDPFGGISDLNKRIAREVSEAFAEDTLRVLRAARFISRFQLNATTSLIELCRRLTPTDISNERVGMELMKTLKTSSKPSSFFQFLRHVGWLKYYFGELEDCIGVPQDPKHHPEGCVFTHTMHCLDYAQDWFTRAVMLCHDLGKAHTTTMRIEDKKIQSIGHELAGVELTKTMLKRIHFASHDTINQIACLVELHMVRTKDSKHEKVVRRTLRKLMHYQISYSKLVEVCKCDIGGRPPLPKFTPDIGQDLAEELLEKDEMKPIVTGEDLLSLGLKGPDIGNVLKTALELQDRGTLRKDNWKRVLKGCNMEQLKGIL